MEHSRNGPAHHPPSLSSTLKRTDEQTENIRYTQNCRSRQFTGMAHRAHIDVWLWSYVLCEIVCSGDKKKSDFLAVHPECGFIEALRSLQRPCKFLGILRNIPNLHASTGYSPHSSSESCRRPDIIL